MPRIVTVYNTERQVARLSEMASIRWREISLALARRGYEVDMATAEHKWRLRRPIIVINERLRRVPLSRVRWADYDVVKTLSHVGFDTLDRFGGSRHPFIISKLGGVVGRADQEGIYFYGPQRERLYNTQERIARSSRFVTVLTEQARRLWVDSFGPVPEVLLVPGAAARDIPDPGPDPFPEEEAVRCLFAGNFYAENERSQPEAHRTLVTKLNELGQLLTERKGRLYVLGQGTASNLDSRYVTYMGTSDYNASWNYLQHAHVGVVVSAGSFQHNNESTKIYHYLRAGLPVVSEAGFPNDQVVCEAALGFVVPSGNLNRMADAISEAATRKWDRPAAIRYILEHHTWDVRAEFYDRVIRETLA
jgi:hypothetical protein